MTVFPQPKMPTSLEDSHLSLFPVENIKKNLEKEFATPLCNSSIIQNAECMKVFVRLRPLASSVQSTVGANQEKTQGCMQICEEERVLILNAPKESNNFRASSRGAGDAIHRYAFTKVFQPEISQKDFFDATARDVVDNFIKGQNALIFTYGVTSSGKTYTMQGDPGNEGIIPRAVDVIFNSVGERIEEGSSLQLHLANTLIEVDEKEKFRLNEKKNSILSRASQSELPHDLSSKSRSSVFSCKTLESSSNNTAESASLIDDPTEESAPRRSSFMDFVNSVADDSIVDVSMQGSVRFVVFVSFIEIYNEQIYDLLQPMTKLSKRTNLKLAEDKSRPFVKNLQEVQVNSREEVFKLLAVGKNNLHTAETKLNHNSSRSHCIFTIKLACIKEGEAPSRARMCQLSFCDLAGSERSGKTKSIGPRLKEAQKINSSLLSLGRCVKALRNNQQRAGATEVVPFRDSKLTRLFKSILLGDGKASMIVNVSQDPTLFDETLHVLTFSAVASEVKMIEKPVHLRHRFSSKYEGRKRSNSFDRLLSAPSKRFTIGWEPKQTPIKEQEETGCEEEEEGSEYDEDEEYWEEREKELLEEIKRLKEVLATSDAKLARERESRATDVKELNDVFNKMIDEANENADERLKMLEEYGEEKYKNAVKLANEKIDDVLEEKQFAEERAKELDQECDELLEKLNALEDRYEEDKPLHDQIDALKEQLDEKDTYLKNVKDEFESLKQEQEKSSVTAEQQDEDENSSEKSEELEKLKADNCKLQEELRKIQRFSIEQEREEYVRGLMEENESGREIITEQLQQIETLEKENVNLEKNFKKDVHNYEEKMGELKEKLQETENKLLEAQNEKTTQNANLERELAEVKNDFKSEKTKLEENLKQIGSEKEAMQKESKKLAEEMKKQVEVIQDMESEAAKLNETLRQTFAETKSLQEEKARMTKEISEHEKAAQNFKLKFEKVEEEHQKISAEKEGLQREIKEILEDIESHKQKAEEVKLTMNSTKQQAEVEISKLKKEKSDVLHELENLKISEKDLKCQIEALKKEQGETLSKTNELSSTLEEAVVCAELKSGEVTVLADKVKTLTTQLRDTEEKLQTADSELQQLESETKARIKTLQLENKASLDELKRSYEKDVENTKKDQKKELKKLESEKSKLKSEIVDLQKDVELGKKIEDGMKVEVERLEKALDQSEAERLKAVKRTDEMPSKSTVNELEKDVKILTMERNDLINEVKSLKSENAKLKKENNDLKDHEPSMSVDQASEVEKMKETMQEMDKLQEQQQTMITEYEKQKVESQKTCDQLDYEIEMLKAEVKSLLKENKKIQAQKGDSMASETKLKDSLKEKTLDLKSCFKELSEANEAKLQLETKVETAESELKRLRNEIKTKSDELQRFRDTRDKLSSALERRINTTTACNEELKKKLEDQIETNVKLRSENSKLKAELQVGTPTTHAIEVNVSSNKIPSTPLQSPMVQMLDQSTGMVASPSKPKSDSEDISTNDSELSDVRQSAKKATRGRSAGSSRRPVVKKTSSRRKRNAQVRHPTPIPEHRSSFDEDTIEVSPVKSRRVLRKKKESITVKSEPSDETSDQDATLTNEVEHEPTNVDEDTKGRSRNSRFTEHEDDFPKPELEIDVTPMVKKSRTRKRTIKQENENQENSENIETDDGVKNRAKRRGRKANDSSSNIDDEDSVLKPKSINMTRMGDIIKNSPVGQALKKLEVAISPVRPTISAPASALNSNNPNRQSRRTRKLHAEDISLPLQVTPDESDAIGAVGRGVGLPSRMENQIAGSTIKRRLRRRK